MNTDFEQKKTKNTNQNDRIIIGQNHWEKEAWENFVQLEKTFEDSPEDRDLMRQQNTMPRYG